MKLRAYRLFYMMFILTIGPNCSVVGNQSQKTKVLPPYRPVIQKTITLQAAIEEHLKQVTPVERQKILRDLIKSGIVLDVPETWQMDDPEAIWKAINHFDEPYSAPMIGALDRVHLRLKDILAQDSAAAILYRYGRTSGEQFLEQRLVQQTDIVAADFFAFRKTERLLPMIFRAIDKNPNSSTEVIQDLRSWQSPAVADGLLKAFKNDQDNANYVFPLADQQVQAAQSLIRKLYVTSKSDEGGKVAAAAALIRLDAPEKANMMLFLELTLNSPQSEYGIKAYVVDVLRLTDARWGNSLLADLVEQYLKQTPQDEKAEQDNPHAGLGKSVLAMQAAVALASIHEITALDVVTQLLLKLKVKKADHRLLASVAQSVLELEGSQSAVKKAMGDDWLRRELAKQQLKPLPDILVPQEVLQYP